MSSTTSDVKLLVLLSGPVAVGKSSVATELVRDYNFGRISTSPFLAAIAAEQGVEKNRTSLQEIGDALDDQSDYRWVVDDVAAVAIDSNPSIGSWLVDSVRKGRQVQHFRARYGVNVLHVHLNATEALLRERYQFRLSTIGDSINNTPYSIAIQHPNEVSARKLIESADVVIDVADLATAEIAAEILTQSSLRRM